MNSRDRGLGTRNSELAQRVPNPEPESRSSISPICRQNDPAVYEMLQKADTIGVFQVESRAQMATLPRLQADAASTTSSCEVAIIRPGPIVGQMVHPYLNRRAGREPVRIAHPSLEPILARTLGVPLFQEQLLRMAMVAAGFTGGQAEELRRAMGFKRSEKRMKQIEVQLREGMARQGHHRRGRRADHHVDHVVRAVRISRIARRQLRAARLRERVSEGALPGGVLHGAAQQPADGVLSPGDAREGRAAPRRPLSADRRAGVRLGLPRRARRRDPARPAVRERLARGGGAGDRCSFSRSSPAIRPSLAALRSRSADSIVCPKCGCDDRVDDRARRDRRLVLQRLLLQQLRARLDARGVQPAARASRRSTISSRAPACAATSSSTLADIGALNAFGYDRRSRALAGRARRAAERASCSTSGCRRRSSASRSAASSC